MIHTNRTVTVGNQESIIDSPIILYRGDREVEVEFTLNGNKFTFTNGGNVIKSTNATHGQLVINTPTGENMFSEVTECNEGKVVFLITKEMIDELIEVGFYSFQIRLFDEGQVSRVTIPPVFQGIDIRNPIAAEDETNLVDIGLVDYAIVQKDEYENLATFLPDGSYNKTDWESRGLITEAKLDKIEDALYAINENMEASDLSIFNRIESIKQNVNRQITEFTDEADAEIEAFERSVNTNVEQFKIDTNAAMTAHKNEVSEELESVNEQLEHIEKKYFTWANVKSFGAKGDGVTDDTEAIQEAVNSSNVVFFEDGNYVISDTIIIPTNHEIHGQSLNNTIIICNSNIGFQTSSYFILKNITIKGNNTNTAFLLNQRQQYFDNVRINYFLKGITFEQQDYAGSNDFNRVLFDYVNTCIEYDSMFNSIKFINCQAYHFDCFLFNDWCEGITFIGCAFEKGNTGSKVINHTNEMKLLGVSFISCYFETKNDIFGSISYGSINFNSNWIYSNTPFIIDTSESTSGNTKILFNNNTFSIGSFDDYLLKFYDSISGHFIENLMLTSSGVGDLFTKVDCKNLYITGSNSNLIKHKKIKAQTDTNGKIDLELHAGRNKILSIYAHPSDYSSNIYAAIHPNGDYYKVYCYNNSGAFSDKSVTVDITYVNNFVTEE